MKNVFYMVEPENINISHYPEHRQYIRCWI